MTDSEFIAFAHAFDECWVQGRFDDLTKFLSEDVVFVAPGGNPQMRGIDAAIDRPAVRVAGEGGAFPKRRARGYNTGRRCGTRV
ncbi:MAG: hypothetical protein JO061_06000 [Acidobacteriaceae bacterium]|nr:hypothetical protein [Acidobacteriaceae bacterium]